MESANNAQPTKEKPLSEKEMDIKLLAMDVDGVLTDGTIIVHADGSESKNFHVHDGAWLRIWRRQGLKTAIITGRQCSAVEHRARDLEIDFFYDKALEKLPVLEKLIAESGVPAEQIAYIGDDSPDMLIMERVGFRIAVDNAVPEIKSIADWCTTRRGGEGAVREACDFILSLTKVPGHHESKNILA